VISKRLADEFSEKEMRDAYRGAQTRTYLAYQVRALRNQRGWTQAELGEALGVPQSQVSRIENREYGRLSVSTLQDLASSFDVGLLVKFVSYETFLLHTRDLSEEALQVPSFSRTALDLLTRDAWEATQVPELSAAAHASESAALFSQQRRDLPLAYAPADTYGGRERDARSRFSEAALSGGDQGALLPDASPPQADRISAALMNTSPGQLTSNAQNFASD
jgi:transcriptional regulator with XRE-family HTH domain